MTDAVSFLRAAHSSRLSPIAFDSLAPYLIANNREARQAARALSRFARDNRSLRCDWREITRLVVISGWGFTSPDYLLPEAPKRKRDKRLGEAGSRAKSALALLRSIPKSSPDFGTAALGAQHLQETLKVLDKSNANQNLLLDYLAAQHKAKTGKPLRLSRPAHRQRDSSPESRIPLMLCRYFRDLSGGQSPAHNLVAKITNAALDIGDAFTVARIRDLEIRHTRLPDADAALRSLLRGR